MSMPQQAMAACSQAIYEARKRNSGEKGRIYYIIYITAFFIKQSLLLLFLLLL